MEKIIKKKIGEEVHTFIVQGDTLHDVMMESKKLSFGDVDKCGVCGSAWLDLGAHVAGKKKHKYTTVRCRKCKSCLNFGQQQENPDVFYLRTREQKDSDGKVIKVLDWMTIEQQKQNMDNDNN